MTALASIPLLDVKTPLDDLLVCIVETILFRAAFKPVKQRLTIGACKMKHLLHVDHFIHDLGLTTFWGIPSNTSVSMSGLNLCALRPHHRLPPKLHRDLVRNELALARIIKKGFADLRARVDGAENVPTSAMIVTRDRAQRFALRAFAAARRAKK